MTSISLGLACLGCVLLSLSLKRHYKQVFTDLTSFERWCMPMRAAGYVCVGAALPPSIAAAGMTIGAVLWVSNFALAALAQALLLTYRPQYSARFGGLAVVLIALGLMS